MATRTQLSHTLAGLHVHEWPGGGPTVVALAGLGSGGATWGPLVPSLGDARVVAPDLRGRGGSQQLAGPSGLRGHARDVAAVIAALDLRDVVVLGHSMGAYLAPLVAQEAGDRIARLVLVDGGIRPAFPFFMRPGVVRATFRSQLGRLDRDWPDLDTVLRKGRFGPMISSRPDLAPLVREMVEADLGGKPGALRPRLDVQRAAADAVDAFFGADVVPALEAVGVPTTVLLAENAKKDGSKPFVSDRAAAPWADRLTVKRLPGNHVTVLFDPEVARAVTG